MKSNLASEGNTHGVSSNCLRLVETEAFKRLQFITFLGILSPKFRNMSGYPILLNGRTNPYSGGNRFSHSLRVARLAVGAGQFLDFSTSSLDYAYAWGILHDIATWPLSHTGEAAFTETTDTSSRKLRTMMLKSDKKLGEKLGVFNSIRNAGLDVEVLERLFIADDTGLEGDLGLLHQFIHSPVTPDTIEGMTRSLHAFEGPGEKCNFSILNFDKDLMAGIRLGKRETGGVLKFWRMKSRVYSQYINSKKSIEFESNWSKSLAERFNSLSLHDSLTISERALVEAIAERGLVLGGKLKKYKPPLVYEISKKHKHKTNKSGLGGSITVKDLSKVFVKSQSEIF
jgi:HD domain